MKLLIENFGVIKGIFHVAEDKGDVFSCDGSLYPKYDTELFPQMLLVDVAEVPPDVCAGTHMYIDGAFSKNPAYRSADNDRIAQLESIVDALIIASLGV